VLPSDSTSGVDWFDAGWAVFASGLRDPAFFPPLNDMEAQRQWLGGFGAAWAEAPDVQALAAIPNGEPRNGESLDAALVRVLTGRGELLRQLRAHGAGRASRTVR
jgi:hypothetical protein